MNEKEKVSKGMLIFMFISFVLLVAAIIAVIMAQSPKTIVNVPKYENSESEVIGESLSSESSSSDEDGVFPIGINTATSEELQLIPKIGPATAALIIDYRNEQGTILSFEELLSISGIGEKTVEILKEYCEIN